MKRQKGRLPAFIPLLKETVRTPAWMALSHGARSLYVLLKGYHNTKLENSVYVSTRDAKAELGSHSHRDNVRTWFRELEHYGFIRMVRLAHHGVNGHGRAPHWRLTECRYNGQAPTRDYMQWDGVLFDGTKRQGDYSAKNRSRGPDVGSTMDQTHGPPAEQSIPDNGTSGPDVGSMCSNSTGPDVGSITSLTTPKLPAEGSLSPAADSSSVQFNGSNLFNECWLQPRGVRVG